jgi:hypothetical protein
MIPRGEVRMKDPATGGEKGGKLERVDLIPADFILEVGRCYGYGGMKYSEDNWRRGYPWRWSLAAMFRHIYAWIKGESVDPESGFHHLAHATWHLATLYTFERECLGTDDRSIPGVGSWRDGQIAAGFIKKRGDPNAL